MDGQLKAESEEKGYVQNTNRTTRPWKELQVGKEFEVR